MSDLPLDKSEVPAAKGVFKLCVEAPHGSALHYAGVGEHRLPSYLCGCFCLTHVAAGERGVCSSSLRSAGGRGSTDAPTDGGGPVSRTCVAEVPAARVEASRALTHHGLFRRRSPPGQAALHHQSWARAGRTHDAGELFVFLGRLCFHTTGKSRATCGLAQCCI